MIFESNSVSDTRNIARDFAEKMINEWDDSRTTVIALEGELGAGKTTFIQSFVNAFNVKEKVKSPTFTIMKKYGENIYHLDCYRLRDENDLGAFNLKEIFNDRNNIVLIEWAERFVNILPKNHWRVHIDHISNNERKIEISIN